MVFKINYWYEEKYFPTKRHRKLCSRNVYDSTSIEVKEVMSNNFPVAFIIRKFSSDQEEVIEERIEVRTYNEKLYKAVKYSDYVANTTGWLPLDYIKIYLESYVPFDVGGKNFSGKSIVMESNKADMLLYLQRQATEYLIFDNKVWQVCGEPLYCINTFGRKHGRTGFFVVFSYNENISNWRVKSSLLISFKKKITFQVKVCYTLGVKTKTTHTPKCYLFLDYNIKFGRREVPMFEFIDTILLRFRSCFSRKAAFDWFVVIVVGFLLRSDKLGVTSVIRDLAILPSCYPCLLHFFRADSWKDEVLFSTWIRTVVELAPLKKVSDRVVLIGDGVKRASDGRFLPCIKKMVQESENAKKPHYIYGHFFGAVGVLIGSATKSFCLPLSIRLHDGDQGIDAWFEDTNLSHVVRMFRDGICVAEYFGNALFVLDRYFLTVSLLTLWNAFQKNFPDKLHIITRAKKNCVVYEKPEPYKGRGRKPLHGKEIHLQELFKTEAASFQTKTLQLYGCEKEVRFLSKIYLWGKKLYQPLQFVLAEYDGNQIILVSTDLSMTPEDILTAYSYRFKIEAMFREMKQQVGAFFYHFWTKAAPKLDRYRKKGTPDPLEKITDPKKQIKILETLMATEHYLLLSCIATGILQLLCLKWEGKINVSKFRYLRTPSKPVLSEASMMAYLRKNFFRFMEKKKEITITKIISSKQIPLENEEIDLFIS